MFGRKVPLSRSELVQRGDRARAKGRRRKAISEYRKALALEPGDASIHAKIAPLLAARGDKAEALKSFQAAAEGQIKAGFVDRAIALYVQAVSLFPKEDVLWREVARLHLERARRADAVRIYVQAHRHFRGKKDRDTGIAFLRRAVELDPLHIQGTIALAKLLKKSGRKAEGHQLLAQLAAQLRGPALKKVRRAQFGLSPTPAALWRWMRAG